MNWFEINEGWIDRLLRVIVGFVLILLTVMGPKTAWGWLGVVPLVTGAAGYCPLYALLGFSTCRWPVRHA